MTPGTLTLVDLDQPRDGYRRFISCWVLQRPGLSLVVDPGPARSVPFLVERLRELGVEKLDLVLLTHIHLDHGGGTAELLAAFPGARVVCHASGVKHLQAPARLWQGSRETLGEVAEMYGQPGPVEAGRFAAQADLQALGVEVIPTPGHAPHHLAFRAGDILFAGEALATRMQLSNGREYLRPATPPRFELEGFLASLDRLASLAPVPPRVALAHHGEVNDLRALAARARAQLQTWVEICRRTTAHQPAAAEAERVEAVFQRLLAEEPAFGQGAFQSLPADIQTREEYYVRNSLRGLLGALAPQP
jgi:glyoxylase-like metal-dependent hydrolase (beta-lactamase superfamily II)